MMGQSTLLALLFKNTILLTNNNALLKLLLVVKLTKIYSDILVQTIFTLGLNALMSHEA